MLLEDAMPPIAKDVFEILQSRKELESFVLIGGTALALQAHHQLSEDLDFWLPADSLNTPVLANLIRVLKHDGVGSWVNGNWRVTFLFIGVDVELVNYVDYH
jgi:proteic killer suppression protein